MDNLHNAKNIAVAAVKYYLNETVLTCYATFNLFGSHKDFPDIMNRQTDSTKFFSVAAVVPQPISCFNFCFNFCKVNISVTCFPFFPVVAIIVSNTTMNMQVRMAIRSFKINSIMQLN